MSEESYVSQEDLRMVLRAELAEFKLDILGSLKDLATKAEHEALAQRVAILQEHGSPQAQELSKTVAVNSDRITTLESLKNRAIGVMAVLTLALGFTTPSVISHYF